MLHSGIPLFLCVGIAVLLCGGMPAIRPKLTDKVVNAVPSASCASAGSPSSGGPRRTLRARVEDHVRQAPDEPTATAYGRTLRRRVDAVAADSEEVPVGNPAAAQFTN